VAAKSSAEPPRPGPLAVFAALGRFERLAATSGIVCVASLVLPWYRVTLSDDLVRTGLGSFGFGEAALLLTIGAALVLLWERGRGRRPPTQLGVGTLLIVAGAWSAALVVYLMIDRPDAGIRGVHDGFSLAYGIYIALGGAIVMVFAGLSVRRNEKANPPPARPSPSASSRPRSR